MKRQVFTRISNKLLCWFMLVGLLPMAFAGIFAYLNISKALKAEVQNNLVSISQDMAHNIETHVKERKRSISLLAKNPFVIFSLERISRAFISGGTGSREYLRIDREIRPYLTFYKETFDFYDLFLVSPSGDVMFTIAHEEDFGTNLRTGPFNKTELSKTFNRAATLLETDLSDFTFYKPSGRKAAFIAAPVFRDDGFQGVIAVQLHVGEINKLARHYAGLGQSGDILLFSSSGDPILANPFKSHDILKKRAGESELRSLMKESLRGEKGVGFYKDDRGKKVLASWKYLPHLRWGMVVMIDAEEAFRPVFNLAAFFLVAGFVVSVVVVTLALFVSRTISLPLIKLKKATDSMAEGNLFISADIETHDEIGILARSFNNMVTRHRESDENLHQLQNLLRNIIDSMPSLLAGVDREGRITHWNLEAEKVTGLRFTEVSGLCLSEVLPHLSGELERVSLVIRGRKPLKLSKVMSREKGETRFSDVAIYPLIANGVMGGVVRVDDVTERVRIEEMMIQSEKMVSVGGLAAGMAHEINNPLAGILQNAQVMKKRMTGGLPKDRAAAEECGTTLEAVEAFIRKRGMVDMIESIVDSDLRAARIVENMLSFSRKTTFDISSRDLGKLLDDTVELACSDYDLKKRYDFLKIEIVRNYDPGLPEVPCEGNKIQQVFLNILKNGAEAMATQTGPAKAPRFILRLMRDGRFARIEIEDNGPGMDEATCKRIFEPFFTTKEVGQGTGLGLSVSYFIITDDHKGRMRVKSTPGKGTTFIILLPLEHVKS